MNCSKEIDEFVSDYIKKYRVIAEAMKMYFGENEYTSVLRSAAKIALMCNDC